MKELGLKENIKHYRTKCNMTLEEVAKHLGVSKPTVQRYESGVIKNIPPDKIKEMSTIFNVTPSELYGWDEIYPEVAEETSLYEEFICFLESLGYKSKEISEPIKVGNAEMESYSIELSKEGVSSKFTEEEFSQMQDEINNLIAFKVWEKRTKK